MSEQLRLGSISRSQRLMLLGASVCLGANMLSACGAEPNKVLTAIDCDDPKNNGGISTPETAVPPFIPADHQQANGEVVDTQLGHMPLRGFSAFLSDKAMQQITTKHPQRVYRVFLEPTDAEKDDGRQPIELFNFSSQGTTYEAKSDLAQHANGGWYLKWDPQMPSFRTESYNGAAVGKAASCQAYDIDPHDIQAASEAPVLTQATAECKDTPTRLGGYRSLTTHQIGVLCASAKVIQPFDKQGTLKALVEKENTNAVTLSRSSGYYVRQTETMVTPDNFLVFPNDKRAEQIRPIHEWTHHVYSKARIRTPDAIKNLEVAYEGMKTGKGDFVDDQTFATLSEETYLKKYLHSPDTQGHPYSNADELAASTVTVLRTFPKQFVREYDRLSTKDQAGIRQAVGAVCAMLEAQNSDPKAIQGLIPDIDTIRVHLWQNS